MAGGKEDSRKVEKSCESLDGIFAKGGPLLAVQDDEFDFAKEFYESAIAFSREVIYDRNAKLRVDPILISVCATAAFCDQYTANTTAVGFNEV